MRITACIYRNPNLLLAVAEFLRNIAALVLLNFSSTKSRFKLFTRSFETSSNAYQILDSLISQLKRRDISTPIERYGLLSLPLVFTLLLNVFPGVKTRGSVMSVANLLC